jgi:hypothetical protein
VDVILSDEDDDDNNDHTMDQDDPKGKDEPLKGPSPVANDVEVLGKTSSEMIIPDQVTSDAHGDIVPPVTDRVKAVRMSLRSTSGS